MRNLNALTKTIWSGLLFLAVILPGEAAPRTVVTSLDGPHDLLDSVAVRICARDNYTAVLRQNGTVQLFGAGDFGRTIPPVPNASIVAISTARAHVACVYNDGRVVCWGVDTEGCTIPPEPNNNYVDVACGRHFTVGLKRDGSVMCWGVIHSGNMNVPPPNSGFVAVAATDNLGYAMRSDGSIVTLGAGVLAPAPSIPLPNIGYRMMRAGNDHMVAVNQSGQPVCWGDNTYGQCAAPTIKGGVKGVGAGDYHSLAIRSDGSVVAWGKDAGTHSNVPSPNSGFVAVAGGGWHSAGIKTDGSFVGWGDQVAQKPTGIPNVQAVAPGIPYTTTQAPVALLMQDGSIVVTGVDDAVYTTVPSPNSGFTQVTSGWGYCVALRSDGSVTAWGHPDRATQLQLPKPNIGIVAVSALASHTVMLRASGEVVCKGDNNWGQCDPPTVNTGFVAVSAGGYHSMGLKADGSIVCWGDNGYGQCTVPKPNTGFVAISAGYGHSMGLKSDGSIVCWGNNWNGQCTVPPPNTGFVAIASSPQGSAGLRINGSVSIWGSPAVQPDPNAGFTALFRGGALWGRRALWPYQSQVVMEHLAAGAAGQLVWMQTSRSGYTTCITSGRIAEDNTVEFESPLPPPVTVRIGGRHVLSARVTGVISASPFGVNLTNGDADGDNAVTLFDYLTLDGQFGHADLMADLDDDGTVTLFDYLIVDGSFGAAGN